MSKRQPRDINELAFSLVNDLTSDEQPIPEEFIPRRTIGVKEGGKKGGIIRAARLSPEQRKVIARKAAESRWKKKSS